MAPFVARLRLGPIARDSLLSLGMKVFALGMGFAAAVLAARLLGPRGYGEISVALSAAGIASIFAGLGINGLAVREVARLNVVGPPATLRAFVHWSLRVTSLVAIVLAAVLILISFGAQPYSAELVIAAIMTVLLALLQLVRGLTQGMGKITESQFPLDVTRWLLVVAALAGLLLANAIASPQQVLLIYVGAMVVALAIAASRFFPLVPQSIESRASAEREPWLRAASPFLGIAFFGIVGSEANTILLGSLAGPEQAGLFQPIARIAPIMILASEAIAMPLAPRMTALWHTHDLAKLSALVRKATIASSLSTAVIASAVLLLSPQILGAFGSEFVRYQAYLVVIAAAQLVNAFTGPAPLLLSMVGQMRDRIIVQVLTLLVQVGLGAALIPFYGAGGAATALTVGIVAWSVLHWLVAWRTLGIDTSAIGWLPSPARSRPQS
jgi:O-antigen/teichoic acid export membrane protein